MGKKVTIDESWLRVGAWVLVCAGIVAGAIKGGKWLKENGPKAPKSEEEKVLPTVRIQKSVVEKVQLTLSSQGDARAQRRTSLSAEVVGKLVEVDDRLESGEVFKKDDLLLRIDDADYEAALASSEAALANAKLALRMEEVRKTQALRDWAKLGNGLEPTELVRRVPQIASAKAAVVAAEAAVEKANRDLERTEIRAPFDCLIERTFVDLGAVLAPGQQLVQLVSMGPVEVRLALSLDDYGYLQRDEMGRVKGKVVARGSLGGVVREWQGELIRSEQIVDRDSRSIFVVALFGKEGREAPPIGMFVKAEVEGQELDNVVRVPRVAMVNREEVLLVSEEGKLKFAKVTVRRREGEDVLVSSGLEGGEQIVVTPPSAPVPGLAVKIVGSAKEKVEPDKKKEKDAE